MSTKNDQGGLLEQVIFTAAMSWLAGNSVPLKFDGTNTQVEAVRLAFEASKDFINELHNPSATPATVMASLEKKRAAAENFESQLGISWLL